MKSISGGMFRTSCAATVSMGMEIVLEKREHCESSSLMVGVVQQHRNNFEPETAHASAYVRARTHCDLEIQTHASVLEKEIRIII